MAKIVLSDILSGFDTDQLNANFQKIEDFLNSKALTRITPPGEGNAMDGVLDMNGWPIINAANISGSTGGVQYVHIRYSNDGGTTFTASNGTVPGTSFGQMVSTNPVAPLTPSSYTWASLNNPGSSTPASVVFAADIAALKTVNKTTTSVVVTRYYNATHQQPRSGGVYVLDAADTTSSNNDATIIVANDGGRWKLQINDECLPAAQCGVRSGVMASGTYPSGQTALVTNAMSLARSVNKNLLIDGWVLLDNQLVISAPIKVVFAGRDGLGEAYSANSLPQSAFVLPPGGQPTGQAGVVVEHPGVWFVGGGIVCDIPSGHASTRYPYDGIAVNGHGFRWDSGLVFGCGRSGFRIGEGVGSPGRNSSRTFLNHCRSMWNGDKGFHISDDTNPIDANTFLIEGCIAQRNVNQGLYINKSLFGGTIISFLAEHNGVGLYVEDNARDIVFLGGDFELNDGPSGGGTLTNIILAGRSRYRNRFIGVKWQDEINTSDSITFNSPQGLRGTYLPELKGFSSAGTLTYTQRKGVWSYDGEILTVLGEFWATAGSSGFPSGHLYITLPYLPGFENTAYTSVDPTTFAFPIGHVQLAKDPSIAMPSLPAGASSPTLSIYPNEAPPKATIYLQAETNNGLYPYSPVWTTGMKVGIAFSVKIPINLKSILA